MEWRVVVGAAGAEGEEVLWSVSWLGWFVLDGKRGVPLLFWGRLRRILRL